MPPQEHPLNQIYLLDFGLSEFYIDRNTRTHVQNRLRPPCGTPRYMSIRTHQFRRKHQYYYSLYIYYLFYLLLSFNFIYILFYLINIYLFLLSKYRTK